MSRLAHQGEISLRWVPIYQPSAPSVDSQDQETLMGDSYFDPSGTRKVHTEKTNPNL